MLAVAVLSLLLRAWQQRRALAWVGDFCVLLLVLWVADLVRDGAFRPPMPWPPSPSLEVEEIGES